MSLMISTAEPFRFVPNDQLALPEGERIAYLLAVPSPYSWAALERAIKSIGAVQHGTQKQFRILADGVRALLAGDELADLRERYLAEIEGYLAQLETARGRRDLTAEELKALVAETAEHALRIDEIATRVRRGYAQYAELEADNEFFLNALCIETARAFLVGWENIPADFARGPDGVSDNLLRYIPEEHWWPIRGKVYELRFPTETQRKNSRSPSPGASAPTPSSTASTTPKKARRKATISGPSPRSDSPSSESTLAT